MRENQTTLLPYWQQVKNWVQEHSAQITLVLLGVIASQWAGIPKFYIGVVALAGGIFWLLWLGFKRLRHMQRPSVKITWFRHWGSRAVVSFILLLLAGSIAYQTYLGVLSVGKPQMMANLMVFGIVAVVTLFLCMVWVVPPNSAARVFGLVVLLGTLALQWIFPIHYMVMYTTGERPQRLALQQYVVTDLGKAEQAVQFQLTQAKKLTEVTSQMVVFWQDVMAKAKQGGIYTSEGGAKYGVQDLQGGANNVSLVHKALLRKLELQQQRQASFSHDLTNLRQRLQNTQTPYAVLQEELLQFQQSSTQAFALTMEELGDVLNPAVVSFDPFFGTLKQRNLTDERRQAVTEREEAFAALQDQLTQAMATLPQPAALPLWKPLTKEEALAQNPQAFKGDYGSAMMYNGGVLLLVLLWWGIFSQLPQGAAKPVPVPPEVPPKKGPVYGDSTPATGERVEVASRPPASQPQGASAQQAPPVNGSARRVQPLTREAAVKGASSGQDVFDVQIPPGDIRH